MMDLSLLSESFLERVIAVAEEAGREILRIYNEGDWETVYKEDHSPLTSADKASHKVIQAGLKSLVPQIAYLSEESPNLSYGERCSWPVYWLVDPLDGTKEFINRKDEFTVNIALVKNGKPVLGVVHAPVLGVTYAGAAGMGAFRKSSGAKTPIRASDYRQGRLAVVISRSHASERVRKFLEIVEPVDVLSMGSVLKMCLVAEGRAHFYPRLGPTMEWDTAAAQCIVQEAGGEITDLEGAPLIYNKKNLLNPYFVVCGKPAFPWQKYREWLVPQKST